MLPRTSVNVPWGCINSLLYWIVPLFVSHRNPIRLTRVISSDASQTEHENKMVTLPYLSPGPPVRSDALHESFMIRFKLIWIWIFPYEVSSFATKIETISIIVMFFSHVVFFNFTWGSKQKLTQLCIVSTGFAVCPTGAASAAEMYFYLSYNLLRNPFLCLLVCSIQPLYACAMA